MRAINRKLMREMRSLIGQTVTIALVVGCGCAAFISQWSVYESLQRAQRDYYRAAIFGDVFATVKRAPMSLGARVAEIDGVATVTMRIQHGAMLRMPGMPEPAQAQVVSMPEVGAPEVHRLDVRVGRMPEPSAMSEVLINERFAEAHGLKPGSTVEAIINGKEVRLVVTGVAYSPEFIIVMDMRSGMPDPKHNAAIWMRRDALETLVDLAGSFNSLVVTLAPFASAQRVIDAMDPMIAPYGSPGAYGREKHQVHKVLENEFSQLRTMAMTAPLGFLLVAAFLLNVVLSRIVQTQRGIIAALKALGYDNRTVALHYIQYAASVVVLGTLVGTLFGAFLGNGMIGLYHDVFRMPGLVFRMTVVLPFITGGVTLVAGCAGAYAAVRRAASLMPAEAMQGEAPAVFHETLIDRLGVVRFVPLSGRMAVRNIRRRPMRSLATVAGVAFSAAIMIAGLFWLDAINAMLNAQFRLVWREDANFHLNQPRSMAVLHEIRSLGGVLYAEPTRVTSMDITHGRHTERTVVFGVPRDARLHRVIDRVRGEVRLPEDGIVLSKTLADVMGLRVGDTASMEIFELGGARREVTIVDLVDDIIGMFAYMDFEALNRMLGSDASVTGARLLVDRPLANELYGKLQEMPGVAGLGIKGLMLKSFDEQMARGMSITAVILSIFASVIAIGIVYNSARISLAERSRELASMRVLGMTRGEVSSIFLTELLLLTFSGIPVGFVLGRWLASLQVRLIDPKELRLDLVIEPRTYAVAAAVVLISSVITALLVRRRIDALDLVEVLKTRE